MSKKKELITKINALADEAASIGEKETAFLLKLIVDSLKAGSIAKLQATIDKSMLDTFDAHLEREKEK